MIMKDVRDVSARVRMFPAAFTLIELLVVVAIVSLLIGLLLPAVQAARESSRRSQCTSHLRQQMLAALNFESRHNQLPPGSREHRRQKQEGVGWRVLVLPFLEETSAGVSPDDEGGFSGDKRMVPPSVFICPSADRPRPDGATFTPSDYEGVAGAGQTEESRRDLEDNNCGDVYIDGVFYPESHTRIAEITDGTTHTLAIGERVYILHVWTDGAIWIRSPSKELCMRSTRNIRWPLAANRDQFGYFVDDRDAPADAARTMLLNDLEFDSNHSSGVPFALADGSVHMIDKSIDLSVLRELASRNGQETSRWTP
jgi:prepilin-type N-terminal cleavage/methylation domain-containing protein